MSPEDQAAIEAQVQRLGEAGFEVEQHVGEMKVGPNEHDLQRNAFKVTVTQPVRFVTRCTVCGSEVASDEMYRHGRGRYATESDIDSEGRMSFRVVLHGCQA